MSAQHAAQSVVSCQQEYARSSHLAKLFEDLTTAVIYARPSDAAAFIADEVDRMAAAAAAGGAPYRAVPANASVDSEETAAAYLEEQRVRQLLEELFASLLVAKPADPFAFLKAEALKLQELRANKKPVSVGRVGAWSGASAASVVGLVPRRSLGRHHLTLAPPPLPLTPRSPPCFPTAICSACFPSSTQCQTILSRRIRLARRCETSVSRTCRASPRRVQRESRLHRSWRSRAPRSTRSA